MTTSFYYSYVGASNWYFNLAKAKGHKIIKVNFIKKNFIGGKNYNIREHFLWEQLISYMIGYPSIDPQNSLDTYEPPCSWEFI